VLRERDQLDAAEDEVNAAMAGCEQSEEPLWWVAGRCAEIQVMMARGRHLDALDSLRRLREWDLYDVMPSAVCRKIDRLEIYCRLAVRDLGSASRLSNSIPLTDRCANILARVHLCAGRPDLVVTELTAAGRAPQKLRAGIERLVLLARANLQLGDRRQAEYTLRRAIEQARPERYVRVFLDDTLSLLPLLRAIAGPYPDDYVLELVDHFEHAHTCSTDAIVPPVLEPLTVRERELLAYLSTHLSLPEIAANVFVSQNTIKTHTRKLYRKLGAGSRSQAVQNARLHGLL
jgi:LuxR family maltose regulon positive regulatory protein